MPTAVRLAEPDDERLTAAEGVFFEVKSADDVRLSEAYFASTEAGADLQLYTCGARSARGLETSPSEWRLIASGRTREAHKVASVPLLRRLDLLAGERHSFCLHAGSKGA